MSNANKCSKLSISLTNVGAVDIWLDFVLELLLVCHQIDGVKLVGDFISAEIINHALSLSGFAGEVLVEDYMNGLVDAFICKVSEDVALDKCNRADGDESDQHGLAEKRKQVWLVANFEVLRELFGYATDMAMIHTATVWCFTPAQKAIFLTKFTALDSTHFILD
jgi:hypothetical protein